MPPLLPISLPYTSGGLAKPSRILVSTTVGCRSEVRMLKSNLLKQLEIRKRNMLGQWTMKVRRIRPSSTWFTTEPQRTLALKKATNPKSHNVLSLCYLNKTFFFVLALANIIFHNYYWISEKNSALFNVFMFRHAIVISLLSLNLREVYVIFFRFYKL